MTDEMVAWIREQIDEDERVARAACHSGEGRWRQTNPDHEHGHIEDDNGEVVTYDEGSPTEHQAEHIARHDPARVLREVQAKRERLRFVEQLVGEPPRPEHGEYKLIRDGAMMACSFRLVRIEALPYSDRPGYRDEWRP